LVARRRVNKLSGDACNSATGRMTAPRLSHFGRLPPWLHLGRTPRRRMASSCSPLTILGGLAEFERTLIRARTGEGRERAKARGVRFGRPKKLFPHQRREAIERVSAGEAGAEVARTFGVDRVTVYRLRP
jgi:hypothetical protein